MSSEEDYDPEPSFPETNLRMLEQQLLCDVTFLAGSGLEEVNAHRFMLASRSEVFRSMFCGSIPDKRKRIEIPDVEASALKELFRFFYSGHCAINGDNVMSLMYAAKKYIAPALLDMCTEYLVENMSPDNVCTILQQAYSFDEKELFEVALSHLMLNAEEVFYSDEIIRLSHEVLAKVVQEDRLAIPEDKIYRACVRWARNRCVDLDLEPSSDANVRQALGDVVFLIRFPVMDPSTFTSISGESLLTDAEKVNIFQQIIPHEEIIDNSDSIFSLAPRQNKRMVFIQRFESFSATNQIWQHSGKQDAIAFSCSEAALITGVSLFLPCSMGVLEGDLVLCQGEEKLLTKRLRLEYQPDTYFQSVMFDKPVYVKKHLYYSLIQAFKGAQTFRGQFGKPEIHEQGLTVSFANSDRSMNGTKVTHGQFYGLFLQY